MAPIIPGRGTSTGEPLGGLFPPNAIVAEVIYMRNGIMQKDSSRSRGKCEKKKCGLARIKTGGIGRTIGTVAGVVKKLIGV